jgi:hypothetical protein
MPLPIAASLREKLGFHSSLSDAGSRSLIFYPVNSSRAGNRNSSSALKPNFRLQAGKGRNAGNFGRSGHHFGLVPLHSKMNQPGSHFSWTNAICLGDNRLRQFAWQPSGTDGRASVRPLRTGPNRCVHSRRVCISFLERRLFRNHLRTRAFQFAGLVGRFPTGPLWASVSWSAPWSRD